MSIPQYDDGLASLRAPSEETANKKVEPEKKDNFKGVVTAGWILAVVLPFLGIFLNVWLLRNAEKYDYSKVKASIPLAISIVLSSVLLILLLTVVINFAMP